MINTGTMTKSSHCGNASRAGIEAELLAELGWTSSEKALEGRQGFYDTFYRMVPPEEKLFANFGEPFRIADPGLWCKVYPAQGPTHWCIDAALELHRSGNFNISGRVQPVSIEVGADCQSALRPSSPQPLTELDGKFSVQYTTEIALLDGNVVIDSFTNERRFSPDVQRLLDITTVKFRDDVQAMDFMNSEATVRAQVANGEWHPRIVRKPQGIFGTRVPQDVRMTKFINCAKRAITISEANELAARVDEIESATDLIEIASLCNPSSETTKIIG